MVPGFLGEHAELAKEVVVVGVGRPPGAVGQDRLERASTDAAQRRRGGHRACRRRCLRSATRGAEGRAPELARRRRGAGAAARRGRRGAARQPAPAAAARRGAARTCRCSPASCSSCSTPSPARRRSTAPSATAATRAWSPSGSAPAGTLIAIDRDPLAEERFAELAAESACAVRFIRAGYAEALELLAAEGLRADIAYFDLGMSSMQVDTRERGFSYSYDAPLDMRMDPTQELSAREIVAEWDERRLARALRELRRGAPRGRDRPRDRARAARRRRSRRRCELVDAINSAIPAPARFARRPPRQALLPGAAHRRQRRARPARPRAAARLGAAARGRRARRHLLPLARGPSRQALPRRARAGLHLPARPAGLRLRARARGGAAQRAARSCPRPRRSRSNPRAASARLRAARKLTDGGGRR